MSERGAELIEFALVLPILLLLVLGIVDFGFIFQRLEVVTNAAREGARIRVLPSYTDADAQWRAWNYVIEAGLPTTGNDPTANGTNPVITVIDAPINISAGGSITGKQVRVTYTSPYLFLGPIAGWFGGSFSSVPLTGLATMRCENGSGCP